MNKYDIVYRLLMLRNIEQPSMTTEIANIVLCNLQKFQSMGIIEMANFCYVSPATISRFCKKLGFYDYYEFRASLAGAIYTKAEYIVDQNSQRYIEVNSEILADLIKGINDNFSIMLSNCDIESIRRLSKDIFTSHEAAAFGHIHSQTAAMDLQAKLFEEGKLIHSHISLEQQQQYILDAQENDLIIIISFSGKYLFSLLSNKIKRSFFERGKHPKIVVVSQNKDCADSEFVEYVVSIGSRDDINYNNYSLQLMVNLIHLEYRLLMKSTDISLIE